MFRLLGRKAELIRYIVKWHEDVGGKLVEKEERCISEQHKEEVEQKLNEKGIHFFTEQINQSGNEWFEGLEFESYDEALLAFNAGEEAYKQKKQIQELTDNIRLRADIDYLAIMTGVYM